MLQGERSATILAVFNRVFLFSVAMACSAGAQAALLVIHLPENIAGNYAAGAANFGPALNALGPNGRVVLALDASGTTTDACEPLTNAAALAGRFAIVDRGICTFVSKARNVQGAGAVGMVVINNVPGDPIRMGDDGTTGTNPIVIPVLMVSQADGALIKHALETGSSVAASMVPGVVLIGITISPGPTIVVGQTHQFSATGFFNDGTSGLVSNGVPAAAVTQTANSHNCAILSDETVRCWGAGSRGRLGNGATIDAAAPVTVSGIAGVHSVSAGVNHTCALAAGTGYCWGMNEFGQLGNGNPDDALTPVAVNALSGAQIVSAGGAHNCVLMTDSTVQCWGRNTSGQLGNGTNEHSTVPVTVPELSGVRSVTAGNSYNCALMADSTVKCWGGNSSGQLGDGTTVDSNTPRTVAGLFGASAVTASGRAHTCAVMTDGTLRCWGLNDFGQLGDGTTVGSSTPVVVTGISGATAVSLGWTHTCALLDDSSVRCWGRNNRGQLGNGTKTDSTVPVAVSGLPEVQAIAGGLDHTCALIKDGTAYCWGWNDFGQLGDSTSGYDSVWPTIVTGIGPTMSWSSNDQTVATIDETGLVTGISAGTSLIHVFTRASTASAISSTILTVAPLGTTLPGTDVSVQPVDPVTQTSPVTVTFDSVTGTGTTTVTTSSTGAPPPVGLKLGNPPTYYEISSTASVSGPITICINYSGISYGNENTLKLMHNVGGSWVDVTTSLNTATKTICGVVPSLSPFAIFEREPYPFTGFFSPVANPPAVNTVRAGSSFPVKFSLSGDRGLNILKAGYPLARQISCSSGLDGDLLPEAETTTQSGLHYDVSNDQYVYVWKTDRSWDGSCWEFDLGLNDESTRRIVVRFATK